MHFIKYVIRYNSEFFNVIVITKMMVLCQFEKKTFFLSNGSYETKKISLFSIQPYLKKYVTVFKNIDFWKSGCV